MALSMLFGTQWSHFPDLVAKKCFAEGMGPIDPICIWKCSEALPKHRRHCVASRLCNNMDSFLLPVAWKHFNPFGCRLTGIQQNVEPISGSYLRGVHLFATSAALGLL